MDKIYKEIDFEIKKVDNSDRTFNFRGSTRTLDRDGEVIEPGGWDVRGYKRKNPVFLWSHDNKQLPIGKADEVRVTKDALDFDITFVSRKTYPFADVVKEMYEDGILNSVSVGFLRKETKYKDQTDEEEWKGFNLPKDTRYYTRKAELLELSAVTVPSNPDALIQRSASLSDEERMISLVKLVKTCEDEEKALQVVTKFFHLFGNSHYPRIVSLEKSFSDLDDNVKSIGKELKDLNILNGSLVEKLGSIIDEKFNEILDSLIQPPKEEPPKKDDSSKWDKVLGLIGQIEKTATSISGK